MRSVTTDEFVEVPIEVTGLDGDRRWVYVRAEGITAEGRPAVAVYWSRNGSPEGVFNRDEFRTWLEAPNYLLMNRSVVLSVARDVEGTLRPALTIDRALTKWPLDAATDQSLRNRI